MNLNPSVPHLKETKSQYGILALLTIKVILLSGLLLHISRDSGNNLPTTVTILTINSILIFFFHQLTIKSRNLSRSLAIAKAQEKIQRETLEASKRKIQSVAKIKHDYNQALSHADRELQSQKDELKRVQADNLERKQALEDQLERIAAEFESDLLRLGIHAKAIVAKELGRYVTADAQAHRIRPRFCNKHCDPELVAKQIGAIEIAFGYSVDGLISQLTPNQSKPQINL